MTLASVIVVAVIFALGWAWVLSGAAAMRTPEPPTVDDEGIFEAVTSARRA